MLAPNVPMSSPCPVSVPSILEGARDCYKECGSGGRSVVGDGKPEARHELRLHGHINAVSEDQVSQVTGRNSVGGPMAGVSTAAVATRGREGFKPPDLVFGVVLVQLPNDAARSLSTQLDSSHLNT